MTIFISPLIKAHAYFAIIEGHVFLHEPKEKRRAHVLNTNPSF